MKRNEMFRHIVKIGVLTCTRVLCVILGASSLVAAPSPVAGTSAVTTNTCPLL